MSYGVSARRLFHGRLFRARTNGAGACVYLPADGLDAVGDSKTGVVLVVPAGGLVEFARRQR